MAEIHLGEPEWSRGSAATAWFPPDSVGMAPPIAHLGLNEKIADPTTAYLRRARSSLMHSFAKYAAHGDGRAGRGRGGD